MIHIRPDLYRHILCDLLVHGTHLSDDLGISSWLKFKDDYKSVMVECPDELEVYALHLLNLYRDIHGVMYPHNLYTKEGKAA